MTVITEPFSFRLVIMTPIASLCQPGSSVTFLNMMSEAVSR